VKLGDESKDPEKLWRELPILTRRRICMATWMSSDSAIKNLAIRALSKKVHSREHTLKSWPSDKCSRLLADANDLSGPFIFDMLREYFFAEQRAMMGQFLDSLGIRHQDCSIAVDDDQVPGETALRQSIKGLLSRFPRDTVELYLRVLLTQSAMWAGMTTIDLDEMSLAKSTVPEPSHTVGLGAAEADVQIDDQDNTSAIPTNLDDGVDSIRGIFRSTAKLLRDAAVALTEGIPPVGIELKLAEFQAEFKGFSNAVLARARELNIEPPDNYDKSLASLEELIAKIGTVENAQRRLQQRLREAANTLDSILRLERRDGRESPALLKCQNMARALQGQLTAPISEIGESPFDTIHAFRTLLLMIDRREELDEDESATAYDEISNKFGTPLVVAVERGLVVLSPLPSADGETQSPTGNDDRIRRGSAPEVVVIEEERPDPSTGFSSPVDRPEPKGAELSATPEVVPLPAKLEVIPLQRVSLEFPKGSDFKVSGEQTLQALASELARKKPKSIDVEKLVWLALMEQKMSGAYQMVCCLERLEGGSQLSISSRLIRAFALGLQIRQPSGSLATQLKADFDLLVESGDLRAAPQMPQSRLMLIAAALCPAICSPISGGSQALRMSFQGLTGLHNLYSLCNDIADYANAQVTLDPIALEYADNSDTWSQQVKELKDEVAVWWGRAENIQFKFPPAGKVWRQWLERGAPIHALLSPIRYDNPDSINELRQAIHRVASENKVRAEVNGTHYQLRGRNIGGDINAAALAVIQRHTREAVEYANRWLSLQEHRPSGKSDYHLQKLVELRNSVDESREAIEDELARMFSSASDIRARASIQCCRAALDRLVSLLHPRGQSNRLEPETKYILSSDLLLIPGLPITFGWEADVADDHLLQLLIESFARNKYYNWEEAFKVNADQYRDHQATDRIIEYLSWWGENKELSQCLTDTQKEHVKRCQDALLRQVSETRKQIENGVARGLVGDRERSKFLSLTEEMSNRVTEIRNFGEAELELAEVGTAIDRSQALLVEQLVQTMKDRGISSDHPAFDRITHILKAGDIDTATEYIELVARNENLPEPKEGEHKFQSFFPGTCIEIESFLADPKNSGSLLPRIESQKGLPGVELRRLPEAKVRDATEMLEAWLALKKAKRANKQDLQIFFEHLGFRVLSVSESASQARAWVALQVESLNHRNQCPIPHFGSLAGGHYRVLCIWDHPSEDEIINLIRPGKLGRPAIVLYFDRLTEMKRRNLASLCQADQLSFLLIDQILVIYLCSEPGVRMLSMFLCTLPFTYVNPYITTSSIVPPEMFYGRKYERRQIMDAMGSCFVFGGRQLGKTALLMSIRDEFDDPTEGRIAIWFDLKAAGVTQDDIWPNLAHAFAQFAITGLDLEKRRTEHGVIEQLQAWLSSDDRRRILLLLDEADRFLESDAKDGFKRTSILKGLMERTNRRFKVVFAGLHNVQRTTKQQNHPLAHFGEPICIGPLLDRGESKEARALIEYPFSGMGFRFESDDLVTRILAQTNYYPSLIQLYCNQLFQFLTRESPASFDWRSSPPFSITAKHVESAYASRQLRSAIRERFELTLNLDLRYRVIALIIALYGHSNGEQSLGTMTVSDIRKHSVYFWERGFRDCRSEEDFLVLLEEMVGLGVLQEVSGHFALRTPNVKSLLGTQDEIESKLTLCAQEEPPPAFEAHLFRTSDQKEVWKRNPLTALQESGLRAEKNAVTVLFGTQAAGLGDLNSFLVRAFGEVSCIPCGKELNDRQAFKSRLNEIKEKLKSGTTLVIIQDCLWTEKWIEEALEWCSKKTVSKFVNFVFVADPGTTWRMVHSRNSVEEYVSKRVVSTIGLQPWHDSVLWQWLGDCRIGTTTAEEQSLISQKTGNWPYLLMEFRKRALGEHAWKPILDGLYDDLINKRGNSDFVGAFGLTIPEANTILREMALLGGSISVLDLISLLDPLPKALIEETMYWADRLSLIRRSSKEEWELDPIVARVLSAEPSR
jgi:hypothetical protein